MSARCPEGHLSESLDYCDVCGSPMGAGADPTPAPPGDLAPSGSEGQAAPAAQADQLAQGATQTCPHCGSLNVADALFCEACGYDFTTGTPPMDAAPVAAPPTEEDAAADEDVRADDDEDERLEGGEQDDEEGSHEPNPPSAPLSSPEPGSGPTELGHSAESAADGSDDAPDDAPDDESDDTPGDREPDVVARFGAEPQEQRHSPPEAADDQASDPEPADVNAHRKARHTPPSRALADAWVVELWVDPDWYAVQQTEEACPSAGVPDIVLLTRSAALIGRPSGSLGVRPEVDAGADSAVSRRHAQLTSDGRRWWVEDLGSSNGTFVGTVGEPLPTTPITPGQRVEIDHDDRLYVGAWTRLVLRQATESERLGTG